MRLLLPVSGNGSARLHVEPEDRETPDSLVQIGRLLGQSVFHEGVHRVLNEDPVDVGEWRQVKRRHVTHRAHSQPW
mgnify:CR=1 FL=1